MTFFLNPKNLIIIVLALLIAAISGLYLWQRGAIKEKEITITKQAGDILALQVAKKDLEGQVTDYKANIATMKKTQVQQQQITTDTAGLMIQAAKIETNVLLEAEDEKIISDATYYFNHGVLRTTGSSDSKTSGEVLPAANAAGTDRPHWTIRQIIENYLIVIDYVLKLEKTVQCYETISD